MTHAKNNAIALGIHILLCGCFFLLRTFLDKSWFPDDVSKMLFTLIVVIVCVLGYLACGFFLLRPVERFPFLSVRPLSAIESMGRHTFLARIRLFFFKKVYRAHMRPCKNATA